MYTLLLESSSLNLRMKIPISTSIFMIAIYFAVVLQNYTYECAMISPFRFRRWRHRQFCTYRWGILTVSSASRNGLRINTSWHRPKIFVSWFIICFLFINKKLKNFGLGVYNGRFLHEIQLCLY